MPCRCLQSVDWVGADVGEVGDEVNIVEAEEGINLLLDVDNGHDGVSVLVVVSPGDGPVGLLLAEGGVEALGWGALLGQVAVGLLGAVVPVDLEGVVAGSDVGDLAGCCLLVFLSSRLIGGLGGLELTPVKTLNSPGTEISGFSPADNSSARSLLLLPSPNNQGRFGVVRSHNRAISELSSSVAKEGVQRGLTVDRDDNEEVAGLVVPDVDVDG